MKIGDEVVRREEFKTIGHWPDKMFIREIQGDTLQLTSQDPFLPYDASKTYSFVPKEQWELVTDADDDEFIALVNKWREIL